MLATHLLRLESIKPLYVALVEILLPTRIGYDVSLVEAKHTVDVQLEIF